MDVTALVAWVRSLDDTVCEPGLTDAEVRAAEAAFDVTFAPLWRAVLREVHPVGWEFPDWRLRGRTATAERITAPVEGVLFDVEHNDFWWHAWGPLPGDLAPRLRVARDALEQVPHLVPVHGHRYVAASDDSPVFSVVQCDLYVPAVTIADLATGRGQETVAIDDWPIGDVAFWSDLHAYSQAGHYEERFGRLGTGGL